MTLRFELCEAGKVDALITFIDIHWKKNHIFVHNRQLFDWQYRNRAGDYNFVLALKDSEIIGVLGFIPTWHFSEELTDRKQLWLAIWKVRDDVKMPGLGLTLLNFLKSELNVKTVCSLGLSQQVVPIYKALKYRVGQLNHYAFFNQNRNAFTFVQPPENYLVDCNTDELHYKRITDASVLLDEAALFTSEPRKDSSYMDARYLSHPMYDYCVYLIKGEDIPALLLVFRVIQVNDIAIGRIVDVQGGNIIDEKYNSVMSRIIDKYDLDYIDVVCNQIACNTGTGFKSSIKYNFALPNYFEPLERSNVIIDYAYKSEFEHLTIYRGDSDQDRPNL